MKILSSLVVLGLLPVLTSCPKPQIPEFCPAPARISCQTGCYDGKTGLHLSASEPPGSDSSVVLTWRVYVLADSSMGAPFSNPKIRDVRSGTNLIVADSLLGNNQKVYVQIQSACTGYPQDKAPGLMAAAFIKRYDKTSTCYRWVGQPF